MVTRLRTSLELGINYYVPRMQSAYNIQAAGPTEFSLGSPAASGAAFASLAPANGVVGSRGFFTTSVVSDCPYGRNVIVAFSAVPGTNAVVEVCGWDYLGQPMAELFTGAAAATTTTPAAGLKAFYRLSHVIIRVAASNAVTVTVTQGAELGLPYKGRIVYAKELATLAYITTALAEGSWVQPVLTDPQTVSTGDPRGTYNGNTAPNGTPRIVGMMGDPSYNTAGNGGLHGIRHFAPSDF